MYPFCNYQRGAPDPTSEPSTMASPPIRNSAPLHRFAAVWSRNDRKATYPQQCHFQGRIKAQFSPGSLCRTLIYVDWVKNLLSKFVSFIPLRSWNPALAGSDNKVDCKLLSCKARVIFSLRSALFDRNVFRAVHRATFFANSASATLHSISLGKA